MKRFAVRDIVNLLDNLEKSIELELTNHCNAACRMCPRHEITRPKGYMEIDTFKQLVKRCREARIDHVSIGGLGEPLLHEKIMTYIDMISELDNITLALTTNGVLLTPTVQDKLLAYPFTDITISISSCDRVTYNRIMGNNYDQVRNNIEHFIDNYPDELGRIQLAIVKSKMNKDEIEGIIEKWASKGVRRYAILIAHNRGGFLVDSEVVDNDFYKNETIRITTRHQEYCRKTSFVLKFVDWQGGVHICCNDIKGIALMGDIYHHCFNEIESNRQKCYMSIKDTQCNKCNMPSTLLGTELINCNSQDLI
ncbi:MAG: radical SAM protein [Planctomycetota bacterium]|jgi:MoaA/NifB/PqqE/SkfB family radical SAM enzyme